MVVRADGAPVARKAASREPGAEPDPPGVVQFSTLGLPEARRIELWEDHNATALVGLRCRTLDGTPLLAVETNLQMDRIHLARVSGSSHVVERSVEVIRSAPAEAVVVYLNLSGEGFFYHADGMLTLQPGQLVLCDADQPFMRGFSHGLDELVVKVPRQTFADLTGLVSFDRPVVVDFGGSGKRNAYAEALAGVVGRAVRMDQPVAADEIAILELFSALATGGDVSSVNTHLQAARSYIDRHLRDPGLSAGRVASGIGISGRQLSRIFALQGQSVPQHILSRRLQLARLLLDDPGWSRATIAEIAAHAGFVSATHFSGAFKDRFAQRPADVRRAARAAAPR